MRIVKCSLIPTHFYDADKYDVCPHCAKQGVSSKPSASSQDSQRSDNSKGTINSSNVSRKSSIFDKTKSKRQNEEKTHSLWSDDDDSDTFTSVQQNSEVSASHMISETPKNLNRTETQQETPLSFETTEQSIFTPNNEPPTSLSQQINQVSMSGNISDIKTVAYYDFEDDLEPVVGWLVVISESDKGISYNLSNYSVPRKFVYLHKRKFQASNREYPNKKSKERIAEKHSITLKNGI